MIYGSLLWRSSRFLISLLSKKVLVYPRHWRGSCEANCVSKVTYVDKLLVFLCKSESLWHRLSQTRFPLSKPFFMIEEFCSRPSSFVSGATVEGNFPSVEFQWRGAKQQSWLGFPDWCEIQVCCHLWQYNRILAVI